jgi:hypothetical protein
MQIDPLFVDTFSRDLGGRTPELMPKLIAAGPPWHGWWGKANEGAWFDSDNDPQAPKGWLTRAIAAAKQTDRLGHDWWYGVYDYANAKAAWRAELDRFLLTCKRAGVDWTKGSGCLNPCIDVENGDNDGVTKQQWLDHMCPLVEAMRNETGREVWVYGGSLPRDLGIAGVGGACPFGADGWEVARYTGTLPEDVWASLGVPVAKRILWQYDGDGEGYLSHYPWVSPIGRTDISAAIVNGGGEHALDYFRTHC